MPVVSFKAVLEKFEKNKHQTGWTYFVVPSDLAQKLNPGIRKEYKIKGKLDNIKIEQTSIMPMGDGNFLIPINAEKRKTLKKIKGDIINVKIEVDKAEYVMDNDFMVCLEDDEIANKFFKTLTGSHQRYFSKWISSAKTDATKTKRITTAIVALSKKMGYSEMIRANKGS